MAARTAYSLPVLRANAFVQIAHNDFPIPRIPQPDTTAPPPPPEPRFLAPLPPSSDAAEPPSTSNENETPESAHSSGNSSAGSSQENNKENAAPAPPPAEPQPSSEPPPPAIELEPGVLPPQITAMIAEITGVLSETFHTYPPHTIQRLSELVLEPRRHYRSLPSYLHAVDRVVHVTSGNNIYPLPPAIPDMSHMSINGAVDGQQENGGGGGRADGEPGSAAVWASASSANGAPIGSDEALGGALLTPIPWLARRAANGGGDAGSESGESSTLGSDGGPSPLGAAAPASQSSSSSASQSRSGRGRHFEPQVRTESTETIDGPNGMGSIETVTVSINGISSMSAAQQQRVITQGELIRQEQRAGVVPVSQLTRSGPVVVSSPSAIGSSINAPADAENDTPMGEGEAESAGGAEAADKSEAPKDSTSEKSDEDMADEEEAPHARGPDIIGAADMGPQTPTSSTFSISSGGNVEVHGIDVEAAVGRKHEVQETQTEGDASAKSESSDDAAILTPASTEPEVASAEPATAAGDGEAGVGEAKAKESTDAGEDEKPDEAETDEAQPPEDMDMEPSSGTMSALPSPAPGKREAEDDLEDELESKRLKGLPEKDEGAASQDTAAEAEASPAQPAENAKPEAESQPETEGNVEEAGPKKGGEGDVGLTDQLAEAAAAPSEPAPAADDTGTETAADGEKKEEAAADEKKDDGEGNPIETAD